jgi:glycerol kinase
MQESSEMLIESVRVDGGASANNFLMQFQSDMLGKLVTRPKIVETTALGAAFLAAIGCGCTKESDLKKLWNEGDNFTPEMPEEKRQLLYSTWKRAVERSRDWYIG